jgi:hypothetical protein
MSKVTVVNGQLVIGDGEMPKDEEPNEKTQSVIDWLAEDEED